MVYCWILSLVFFVENTNFDSCSIICIPLRNLFICLSFNKKFCSSFLNISHVKSSRPMVFWKKGVLENFTKFKGKHLCLSLFFNKVKFCEILKNTSGACFRHESIHNFTSAITACRMSKCELRETVKRMAKAFPLVYCDIKLQNLISKKWNMKDEKWKVKEKLNISQYFLNFMWLAS